MSTFVLTCDLNWVLGKSWGSYKTEERIVLVIHNGAMVSYYNSTNNDWLKRSDHSLHKFLVRSATQQYDDRNTNFVITPSGVTGGAAYYCYPGSLWPPKENPRHQYVLDCVLFPPDSDQEFAKAFDPRLEPNLSNALAYAKILEISNG